DTGESGRALDFRFARNFFGVNSNLQTTFFNNFESQITGNDSARSEFQGTLRLNKGFKLPFAGLNLSFDADHNRFEQGSKVTRLSFGQNLNFEKFSAGHRFSYLDNGDNGVNTAGGSFNFNTNLTSDISARAALNYRVEPTTELGFLQFALNNRDKDLRAGLQVTQGLEDPDFSQVRGQVGYDFGSFLGSAVADWNRDRGFDLSLRASTTFGPDGLGGEYITTTAYRGSDTAVSVRLYEDLDFDGVFSEGDMPIADKRIRVNQLISDPSDEEGYIHVLGAGGEQLAYITLDEKSWANELIRPIKEGYSVVLRRGTRPFINFPLYQTGIIDGSVKFPSGRGVGGMRVQLLDDEGNLVEEVETLFYGFYLFEFVRPGNYVVRLDPSYRINVPPKTITVSSEKDLFAYGVDFLLEQASEDAATDIENDVRDGGRVAQKLTAPVAVGTLKPAPTLSDRPSYTAIRAVRIGEHPYKVRLVLDLSAPSVYQVSTESDGAVINIDLKDTVWDVPTEWTFDEHPIFKSIKPYALPSAEHEGTRIRLEAKRAARLFYNADIPAENGLPDRIYVDLIRKQ
ncbi:MAG: carboxypeptidase-like regulatory domain-containing protein, partial [Pseudomonadota bacterium]